MKKMFVILALICAIPCLRLHAQVVVLTLQQVTDAGSITTNAIGVHSVTASNTSSDDFVPYYKFGHAGQDSISWQLGLTGKQRVLPPNPGDALTLKSYLPTGAFLRDEMIITRGGSVTFAGSAVANGLRIGASPVPPYAMGIAEINGSLGVNGTLAVTNAVVTTKSIFQSKSVTVTGNYTVADDDLYINVDNTAPCTITLPPVNTLAFGFGDGRLLYIKKINNNAASITVNISQTLGNSSGTQTIDGAATYMLSGAWEAHLFHDNGANWFVY